MVHVDCNVYSLISVDIIINNKEDFEWVSIFLPGGAG